MNDSNGIRDLDRSPHKIDRDSFARIFMLTRAQPWLEGRQAQLLELIDLCLSADDQVFVCDLLYRFTFLSGAAIKEAVDNIAHQICKVWAKCPADTLIVARNKSDYSDSSQAILWYLKPAMAALGNEWNVTNFVSKMTDAIHKAKSGDTIVIVDEFVGTGTSLSKAIAWFHDKLAAENKRVCVVACMAAAMEQSRSVLAHTSIQYHAVHWLKRGITDYYEGAGLAAAVERMVRLEKELAVKVGTRELKKYSFGYGRSEATYAYENGNIPNNAFPIFWWPSLVNGQQRQTLFSRLS